MCPLEFVEPLTCSSNHHSTPSYVYNYTHAVHTAEVACKRETPCWKLKVTRILLYFLCVCGNNHLFVKHTHSFTLKGIPQQNQNLQTYTWRSAHPWHWVVEENNLLYTLRVCIFNVPNRLELLLFLCTKLICGVYIACIVIVSVLWCFHTFAAVYKPCWTNFLCCSSLTIIRKLLSHYQEYLTTSWTYWEEVTKGRQQNRTS